MPEWINYFVDYSNSTTTRESFAHKLQIIMKQFDIQVKEQKQLAEDRKKYPLLFWKESI